MAAHARCFRHPPRTWIAGCADCTTWHLAELAITATPEPTQPEAAERRHRTAA
jgi:hypothetical protein